MKGDESSEKAYDHPQDGMSRNLALTLAYRRRRRLLLKQLLHLSSQQIELFELF